MALVMACTAPGSSETESGAGSGSAPESEASTSAPVAAVGADPRCARVGAWFSPLQGASSGGADVATLSAQLPDDPRQATATTLDTLDRIAGLGPEGIALSDRLLAYVESPASDRIAAAAVRALASVDPERFATIAPAFIAHPDRALPARFEMASELARAGRVELLAPLFDTERTGAVAARRAMIVARRHPAALRDAMFGEAGPCYALGRDECFAIFRDLVVYDPALEAGGAPELSALLRAESQVLSGAAGSAEAWRAAAEAAMDAHAGQVTTSASELGAYGAAEAVAPVFWRAVEAGEAEPLTRRALASHALAAVSELGAPPATPAPDALASAIRFVMESARGATVEVPEGIDAQIDGAADPFSAALLVALAKAGEADAAERAGRRFPRGTVALLEHVAAGQDAQVIDQALADELDASIAAHALRIAAGDAPGQWAQEVDARPIGTPERRALLLARLGGDSGMAMRAGEALSALPSLEASVWLASQGVDVRPWVLDALTSADANARRRAAMVAARAGVEVDAVALRSAVTVPSASQRIERRDARVVPLRLLLAADAEVSLDEAIATLDALDGRDAGRFETAVVLQRAWDAHCAPADD